MSGSGSRSRWRVYAATAIVLVLLLLLWRGCPRHADGAFDYFRDQAERLGRDPQRVAKFVADLRTPSYDGDVKGPLATLWEGAGSAAEKQALTAALLAHCEGGKPAAPDGGALKLTIVHRGARESVVYEGPIGDLVGDVHSIETTAAGRTRLTIRAATGTVARELDAGADGEEIIFRVQRPGGEPLEIGRELWHHDNRVGPVSAVAGDRHDFVVLPCRISEFVRTTEEKVLRQRGRDQGDDGRDYLTLLDYCRRSDRALADLEHDLHVQARFDLPRILMLSRAKVPDLPDGVLALDLRLDRVTFDGAMSDAHLAVQVRSFVESGLEHHFLQQLTQQPCTSTWDVFGKLHDDYPNSYDRRLGLVRQTIEALGERGRASFRASADGPVVTVTKDGHQLEVAGGKLDPRLLQELAKDTEAPPVGPHCTDVEAAAVAVELSLMGTGAVPDYVLEVVDLARDEDSLVVPGARFTMHWGEGAEVTDQTIDVTACGDALQFGWRLQTGLRPVRGTRTITATAMAAATTHNPWYVVGDEPQGDATSFCVSRLVHQRLLEGKPFAMALQDQRSPQDEPDAPRRIAWHGDVTPLGPGTHKATVNGREATLRTQRLRCGDRELAVLDDARFPVGMADAIVDVRTSIRLRLVDEAGIGISAADVEVDGCHVHTGPDGRCVLPPVMGTVKLVARREQKPFGEREVDLTAPGLDEVVVAMPRPRSELLFVTKDSAQQLAALELSAQCKRNVDRYLDRGYQVVIPNHAVEVDGIDVYAFYAHDVASGEIVAVTEDGLHGSLSAYARALASLARDLAKVGNKPQPFVHVHALRGALIAWWLYGKERVGGSEHEEAINRMLKEMDDWEKATNLLTGLEPIPGARTAANKLLGKSGWDIDNAGAAAAFKIGFIGSTYFLDHKLEGS